MTPEHIADHLQTIEQEHDVKILLAVESGSRAWGFESKNSDWDVRFIYVHKPQWYFSVDKRRDVIELMDGDMDLSGWELRKALVLLRGCNPSLFEWLNSPIVYSAESVFMARIKDVAGSFYNPVASMYHYYSIFKKHNERYLQKEGASMKRFLYYLRGILACKWIEAERTVPPVAFAELVAATVDDDEIRGKIEELIRLKKSGEEHGLHVVDSDLMEYARHWADYYTQKVEDIRPERKQSSTEVLDALLYDMVQTFG